MKNWIYGIWITLGILLLGSGMSIWAGAEVNAGSRPERVFDQAGLLTASQMVSLEQTAVAMADTMKMDVVVVTTSDTKGKTTVDYGDDYYDDGGFGIGDEFSGVLFLVDMDNRQLYISTSGTMMEFLTDKRIDQMLDNAYRYAQNGDYSGALDQFLKDMTLYYEKGIPSGQYLYDTETGKITRNRKINVLEALLSLGVAGFSGVGACFNVKRQYAMKQERGQASNYHMAYRGTSAFAFQTPNDVLANSYVTQKMIPRTTGNIPRGGMRGGGGMSSTHRSSSGRSHGGGGRGF